MATEESRLNHSIRGCMNAMTLGMSALEIEMPPTEKAEFLTDIEKAAVKMIGLMEQWESLPQANGASS